MEFKHISVLLNECIENLNIKPDGVYVDGTMGGGGHSREILKRLTTGKLIAFDKDMDAIISTREKLKEFQDKLIIVHDDFKNFKPHLEEMEIDAVDGFLLDLGVSSYQIDNKERGFTYNQDAVLDMRMNQEQDLDARDILRDYDEKELANIFYKYGEEPFSRPIAKKIVEIRQKQEINTSKELVEIVRSVLPKKLLLKGGNPAKRVFQALRIEVNQELSGLFECIVSMGKFLKNNGRLCVISFHSLEDRIVKNAYKELSTGCICPPSFPICVCGHKKMGNIITRKPILPTEIELEENKRSASSKLRVFEREA